MLLYTNNNWPAVEQNRWTERGKWGWLAKILVREGADKITIGRLYVAVLQVVLLLGTKRGFWHLSIEIPWGVSPPGIAVDGTHGPQKSAGRDVGVPTHWGGSGNFGNRVDQGIYLPPPEYGHTIHCDLIHHGLVFGGGEDSSNASIQAMVRAALPGYNGYQGGACRRGEEGGDGGGRSGCGGRVIVGAGRVT